MVTKVKGIIINNQFDYDEYDKICTIFSDKCGKVSFYAPGVNRMASKNKYSLNLFSYGEFELFLSHNDRLSKLKTGYLIESRYELANNYENYLWAQWICDIIYYGLKSYVKNYMAFSLLLKTLESIVNNDQFMCAVAFFLFKSLNWFGVNWKLDGCVRCQKKAKIKTFSTKDSGFVCTGCFAENDVLFELEFMKILLWFDQNKNVNYSGFDWKTNRYFQMIIKIIMEYFENIVSVTSPAFYELKKRSLVLRS